MSAVGSQSSPRMRLALRFISGKYQGGEFPIEENKEVVVGRSSDLDMVLVEEMVSRKHARIELRDGIIHIEDLGSTNGTFVNGERIVKAKLKEGDRILIGSNILKVIATSDDEPAPHTRRGTPSSKPQPRRGDGATESRMRGSLEEIPLPDLLQLFGTSRKTGVLVIETAMHVGRIYLKEGLLHYATVAALKGAGLDLPPLKALYRMLTWESGSFELEPPNPKTFEPALDAAVQEVLMEGFRQRDELEHLRGRLPSSETALELVSPITAPLRELRPEQLDVLQAAVNAGTVGGALDEAPHPDLEVATALLELMDRGYVRTI